MSRCHASPRMPEAREVMPVVELCERYLEAARAGLVTTLGRTKRSSTIAIDEGAFPVT
jgi:hypothetical protein